MSDLAFSHVVFDLDGTLLDTLEDLAQACNWVCERHGWPTYPTQQYKSFVGNGAAKLLERVSPPEEITPALQRQTMEEFTRYYNAHKTDHTRVYPGMPQALEELGRSGVSMAVLSNKPDLAARPVVERYYPGVFPFVQGAVEGVPVKPDPTALFALLERMGARRERTLFVGDSNVDIQTAKNAGLASCGVLWGFRSRQELEGEGADYLAADPRELERIILEEGAG